jgi:DNA-binding NtrC family response regulator
MCDRHFATLTILVIDPRRPFRDSMRVMLESVGHRVLEAQDAARGLATMDGETVDAVLIDLLAPGLATLMAIRMDCDVPIVTVTRPHTRIDVRADSGLTRAIEAPLSLEDLIDTIAQVVASSRAAKRAQGASQF